MIVGVVAIVGLLGYLLLGNETDPKPKPLVSPKVDQQPDASNQELPQSQPVTIRGEVGCLPSKGSGPMTMECAIGLNADDGKWYGLNADDPTLTGSQPTGSKIEVFGALQPPNGNSKFDIAGVIKVEKLQKL